MLKCDQPWAKGWWLRSVNFISKNPKPSRNQCEWINYDDDDDNDDIDDDDNDDGDGDGDDDDDLCSKNIFL